MKIKVFLASLLVAGSVLAETVEYTGKPIIINASTKASNIVILPEPVKNAYSSSKGVKVTFTEDGNKIVLAVPDTPSDLVVEGESGTLYVFNINPVASVSQIVEVRNRKVLKEKERIKEANSQYDDYIAYLVSSAIKGNLPEVYEREALNTVIIAQDVTVTGRMVYRSDLYSVYVVDIHNKTSGTVAVREDSPFAEKVALKVSGVKSLANLRAIAIDREIIKPYDTATMYIVVEASGGR